MLGLIKEVAKKKSITVYSFCLMSNHIHLLISLDEENLFQAMQGLFSHYARYFNRKYERKGHLFGGPYRQAGCLDEKYLLVASLYIHLNPVRAGITNDPFGYRWSSCNLYVKKDPPKSFVSTELILSLLSDKPQEGRRRYRELFQEGTKIRMKDVFEKESAIKDFKRHLSLQAPNLLKNLITKGISRPVSGRDLIDEEELERAIKELKGKNKKRLPETWKAKRFLIEQLIARGYSREEIAQKINLSRKTIYNLLKSS
jgi:putative transposase